MSELSANRFRPVWVASYPRSGNTFLRIILQNIFHLPSYSLYNVEGRNYPDPSAEALEEAPLLPVNWRQLLSHEPKAPLRLIKTHGPPEDDAPAIYIARDGRAAIHSYYHYHKKYAFEQPSLTEVIAGACQFGSWSEHFRAWQPRQRPQTLFLRYDDLVGRPAEVIPDLARFLQTQPVSDHLPTFAELQGRVPAFFRRGQNQDYLAEWTPGQMALFNRLHGDVMRELGFTLTPTDASFEAVAPELAQSAARLHALYMQQLARSGELAATCDQLQQQAQGLAKEKAELLAESARQRETLARPWVRLGMAVGLVQKSGRNGR